ncbi:MAG: integrase [Cycloclasticus sp.]|nr:MAG: integrase [Cycloclasticus sp.]
MDALAYDLKQLCSRNRNGSKSTQANRLRILSLVATQIADSGFKLDKARSLKPKHIGAVLEKWKADKLTTGTIKNRMAAIRWWAGSVNKTSILQSNEDYGIEARANTKTDKSHKLNLDKLDAIECPKIKMAVRLQAAFGLRREEAIKFTPAAADKGKFIALKASTTKGGRYREIAISTDRQRQLLNEAKELANGASLIPADKNYKQQLKAYENQTLKAGLKNNHGLRHNYAQWRYQQLTGWKCPAKDGLKKTDMTTEQWQIDRQARADISEELGHSRIDITDVYLGSATQ